MRFHAAISLMILSGLVEGCAPAPQADSSPPAPPPTALALPSPDADSRTPETMLKDSLAEGVNPGTRVESVGTLAAMFGEPGGVTPPMTVVTAIHERLDRLGPCVGGVAGVEQGSVTFRAVKDASPQDLRVVWDDGQSHPSVRACLEKEMGQWKMPEDAAIEFRYLFQKF